tara:strand:+ start:26 stop:286 length:261 start_codon:yes stop_codon:yes gene_type:complete
MTTYEEAIEKALDWSKSNPNNVYKSVAQTYIEALPMAEMEGKLMYNNPAKGRAVQILYILSNLQGWRGAEAREAKVILKAEYEENK